MASNLMTSDSRSDGRAELTGEVLAHFADRRSPLLAEVAVEGEWFLWQSAEVDAVRCLPDDVIWAD